MRRVGVQTRTLALEGVRSAGDQNARIEVIFASSSNVITLIISIRFPVSPVLIVRRHRNATSLPAALIATNSVAFSAFSNAA